MPLFFVAILPPDPLLTSVLRLKEEISFCYGSKKALRLPAHITLLPPFDLGEHEVPGLHTRLKEIANNYPPFSIKIHHFGSFPPKVIYLAINESEFLFSLQKLLADFLQGILGEDKEKRKYHPHMTVATRDLTITNFKRAWKEFREREFSAAFMANEIHVFRHNGRSWEDEKIFPLRGG